jgi:hypothetical protein
LETSRAGLKILVDKKAPSLVGIQILAVQPAASHWTNRFSSQLQACYLKQGNWIYFHRTESSYSQTLMDTACSSPCPQEWVIFPTALIDHGDVRL